MRKLRKILCLLFIVGIVASMPFETQWQQADQRILLQNPHQKKIN